ncbi:MAG: hypothetical protein AABY51_09150 [Deltaproteobacteria bacterium]
MAECIICGEVGKVCDDALADTYNVDCSRCGKYKVTGLVSRGFIETEFNRERANISGWLRENQGSLVSSDNISMLRNLKTPSFHERADKVLMILEKNTSYAGELIRYRDYWISQSWCLNKEELWEILEFLGGSERIKFAEGPPAKCKIMPKGWEHLEHLKQVNVNSQQGFVAMWFDDDMKKVYNDVIAPAICDAGYKPHRVDLREHNNKIDDEIIAEIRRSRFVLADFTGHRSGVYYEAGFAKGLGLEVFWTCRDDCKDELHFDIRQFNCILWEQDKLDEFRKGISHRIESVLGRGTYNTVAL